MVPYTQECVYSKLSDMNNLAQLRERLDDPSVAAKLNGQLSEDKIKEMKKTIENMKFDTDSLTANVPPVGEVSLHIVERQEPKCIKYETQHLPFTVNMWVQLLPVDEKTCKMKVTLRAELNMMMRMIVGNKLQDAVDQIADLLAQIPYGE